MNTSVQTVTPVKVPRKKFTLSRKQSLIGWLFIVPAAVLIAVMNYYPMVKAFILSLKTGMGSNLHWTGFSNYSRLLQDNVFIQSIKNTFIYLIIEVPVMLILALILASMLNDRNLKLRGLFRTAIFLPCATSLVSYALIFRSLFAADGFVNTVLIKLGILKTAYPFLTYANSARAVIIIALIWRWTGYNMVFYLAGLQNIDYSLYEAARIDGASPSQCFWKITVPLLKPIILLTAIMSTNGTLQLFDESWNLTQGGPGNATITMSHYIYNLAFRYFPNIGYACAVSYVIFVMVAILSLIQLKVGDKRE